MREHDDSTGDFVLYCVNNGQWFASYDPFGDPPGVMPYRTGRTHFTDDVASARRFHTRDDAMKWWRQVHPTAPIRDDGQPNRPMTAHTVEIFLRDHIDFTAPVTRVYGAFL